MSSVDGRIGPAVVACYSSTFERQWDYGGVSTQYRALHDHGLAISLTHRFCGHDDAISEANGLLGAEHFKSGFVSGLDKQDLYIARAPRPTLQLVTTDDPAFPLAGAATMTSGALD